jgi:SAM-dependent methyltransferase
MASDLKARVKREAEFYDTGQDPRGKLDAALAYLDEGIGRQRRREVIREAMK